MTEPRAQPSNERRELLGIVILFFASGMSGLVFEVIWVRSLALWVGHSTVAVSLVVASFLSGIVLGSYLGGRWADRARSPLALYAVLELAVGASALGVSMLVSRLGHGGAFGGEFGSLATRMVASFLLLLPPTVAMGATTPVLTRFVTRDLSHVGQRFALLYAVNTLGAAFGCAAAGFFWIGRIGLLHTALVAVAVNVTVGSCALVWSRRLPSSATDAGLDVAPTLVSPPHHDAAATSWLYVVAFATGAASIACEVLWFRVLRTFVDSSTYAFTLLLTTFLGGLVIGGALYAWKLARHPNPWQLVADLQGLLAGAGLLSLATLGMSGNIRGWLDPISGAASPIVAQGILVMMVILVPTILCGATYPLVMKLGSDALSRVGRTVGTLAAANTVGGAIASLVTGLWLIPAWGTQKGLTLAFSVNLAVAVGVEWRAPGIDRRAWPRRLAWPAVFVVLAWFAAPSDYLRGALTYWSGASRVLAVREGRDGTAVVDDVDRASVCHLAPARCKDHCKADFHFQQLTFGSMSYASTLPFGRRYMRTLGHLPMLLDPDATDALEICFGTGTTAGALIDHAGLRSLTIVDINRDVFELAPLFRESNHDVLTDPRVHPVVDDGRHYLLDGTALFDVVSLEPPPPEADGAASLYTTEFYELVRRRLKKGGVLAQWIPFHTQSEGINRSLLRSILDVFPEVNVYIPSRAEGVIVASDRSLKADVPRWDLIMGAPRVRASLAEVSLDSPEAMLGTFVLDTEGVRRYVGDAPPVTDDLPAVEFFRSRPGAPFSIANMLEDASDPRTNATPLDPTRAARLEKETAADRLQMKAFASFVDDHGDESRAQTEAALAILGDGNVYARAVRDVEVDCLEVEDR